MPKQSEAWANTMNHMIKKCNTCKRKSLLEVKTSGDDVESVLSLVGLKRVGRPTKETENIKKQLAFSDCQRGRRSNKEHNQYKTRKWIR